MKNKSYTCIKGGWHALKVVGRVAVGRAGCRASSSQVVPCAPIRKNPHVMTSSWCVSWMTMHAYVSTPSHTLVGTVGTRWASHRLESSCTSSHHSHRSLCADVKNWIVTAPVTFVTASQLPSDHKTPSRTLPGNREPSSLPLVPLICPHIDVTWMRKPAHVTL